MLYDCGARDDTFIIDDMPTNLQRAQYYMTVAQEMTIIIVDDFIAFIVLYSCSVRLNTLNCCTFTSSTHEDTLFV